MRATVRIGLGVRFAVHAAFDEADQMVQTSHFDRQARCRYVRFRVGRVDHESLRNGNGCGQTFYHLNDDTRLTSALP